MNNPNINATSFASISTKAIGKKTNKDKKCSIFCYPGFHEWEVKGDLKCSSKTQVCAQRNLYKKRMRFWESSGLDSQKGLMHIAQYCTGAKTFFELLRRNPVFLHGRTLYWSSQEVHSPNHLWCETKDPASRHFLYFCHTSMPQCHNSCSKLPQHEDANSGHHAIISMWRSVPPNPQTFLFI